MKKLTPTQYWRIALGVCAGVCVAMVGVIWLSGGHETAEALHNGQRLIITLQSGAIDGTQAPDETQKPAEPQKKDGKPAAPVSTPTPTPTPSPTPTASPTATSSDSTPAVTSTPTPTPSPTASPSATPSPTPTPQTATETKIPDTKIGTLTPTPSPSATTAAPSLNGPRIAHDSLAAPMEDLMEKTNDGAVPIISEDGAKPWHYYAKHYIHRGHLPMIAMIVSGLGQNKNVTDMALKLPENTSLSFTPYAHDVGIWAGSARASGHEVLMDLPLEPGNYPATDPGPYGLLAGIDNQHNASRLNWLMSRAQAYVGFVTPQNEVYSANTEAFKALLATLNKRGLMMAMGHEPAKSETTELLNSSKVAYSTVDILVDEELSATAIQSRLVTLEKLASKRGYAVGLAQAFPLSLQQLSEWSAKLEKDGYELVPVTFITSLKFPD